MSASVFISHSSEDEEFVQQYASILELSGFEVFVSRIEGNAAWQATIEAEIDNSGAMVVLLTENAIKSDRVEEEFHYARDVGLQPIAVHLDGAELTRGWQLGTGVKNRISAETVNPAAAAGESITPLRNEIDRRSKTTRSQADRTAIEWRGSRFGNHPDPDGALIGRQSETDELGSFLSALIADRRGLGKLVLHGASGVGKSLLAHEVVKEALGSGHASFAWWIRSDTEQSALNDLALLSSKLALPRGDNVQDTAKYVREWLETCQEPWLLVCDDAPKWDGLLGWLPPNSPDMAGTVVVTSNNSVDWPADARRYSVDQLSSREVAAHLLIDRAGLDDHEGAMRLAERLGRLPAELVTAANMVRRENESYDWLIDWLDEQPSRLGETTGNDLFAPLVASLPDSHQRLLQVLSWMEPESIPRSLIQRTASDREIEIDRTEILGPLLQRSLVHAEAGGGPIRMNRLVQLVGRKSSCGLENAGLSLACRVLTSTWPTEPEAHSSSDHIRELAPHLDRIADDVLASQLEPSLISHTIATVAASLRETQNYQGASGLLERGLEILPGDLRLLAEAALSYGHTNPQRTIEVLDSLLGDGQSPQWKALPPTSWRLAAEARYGHALRITNGDTAQEIMTAAIEAWRHEGLPESTELGRILLWQGDVALRRGSTREAMDWYREAFEICNAIDGAEQTKIRALADIGLTYRRNGNYSDAFQAYEEAEQIAEVLHGRESVFVISVLNNKGFLQWKTGDYKSALETGRACFELSRVCYAPGTSPANRHERNLGLFLVFVGDHADEATRLKRCLDTSRTIDQPAAIGVCLRRYAEALRYVGRLPEALEAQREQSGYPVAYPADGVVADAVLAGVIAESGGGLAEARKYIDNALLRSTEVPDWTPEHEASLLYELSIVEQHEGDLVNAFMSAEKALAVFERLFLPSQHQIVELRNRIVNLTRELGPTAE